MALLGNIRPDGRQKDVIALPIDGHYVVLGTAGSGKTTMALLRAVHLANLPQKPNVLIVTFNRALVQYMRNIWGESLPNLRIENYHRFAQGYLNSLGLMPLRDGILYDHEKKRYVQQALDYYHRKNPDESTFMRPCSVFLDEITFIERFGFTEKQQYLAAERIGRASANIKRENRPFFYDVYEKYLKLRREAGFTYDWDDIALHTYQALLSDTRKRLYQHIIVDEGQDFSPMMIRSLTEAAKNGSFTFFGDVAQQIYGSRLSWRDSGIKVQGKIWKFENNYRNPQSVVTFAKDIANSDYWDRNDDIVEPEYVSAKGPKPVLLKFASFKKEISWLIEFLSAGSQAFSSNVIIVRNWQMVEQITCLLRENNLDVVEIDKDRNSFVVVESGVLAGIYISTFHSVKGLEFDNVFIPMLSSDIFPNPDAVKDASDRRSVYSNELKLLYVAVTRSKYGLYMSYHGELSPLFPKTEKSCDFVDGDNLNGR